MTIRDLIQQEIDIDVCDDVCEELSIAFCGPLRLTEEGQKQFADVMDYPVKLHPYGDTIIAVVMIDGPDGDAWEGRLEKAKDFFESAAGYCACSDYDHWFIDN